MCIFHSTCALVVVLTNLYWISGLVGRWRWRWWHRSHFEKQSWNKPATSVRFWSDGFRGEQRHHRHRRLLGRWCTPQRQMYVFSFPFGPLMLFVVFDSSRIRRFSLIIMKTIGQNKFLNYLAINCVQWKEIARKTCFRRLRNIEEEEVDLLRESYNDLKVQSEWSVKNWISFCLLLLLLRCSPSLVKVLLHSVHSVPDL